MGLLGLDRAEPGELLDGMRHQLGLDPGAAG
jgi:hypothetical protein